MAGSFLIRTILEVERKFSNIAVKDLTSHAGNPPFRTLQHLRPRKFTDVYYDKSNILSTNGIWIRRRDGLWQAKVRQGGDFSNSKFEEITDPLEIARYVRALAGGEGNQVDCFGLKELATLTTFRQSWLADDEFRIVLDQTDFGHTVGEVELQRSIQFEPCAHSTITQLKEAEMKEMDNKIIQFMDRYSWAFCNEIPKGKLTAFFEQAGRTSLR